MPLRASSNRWRRLTQRNCAASSAETNGSCATDADAIAASRGHGSLRTSLKQDPSTVPVLSCHPAAIRYGISSAGQCHCASVSRESPVVSMNSYLVSGQYVCAGELQKLTRAYGQEFCCRGKIDKRF